MKDSNFIGGFLLKGKVDGSGFFSFADEMGTMIIFFHLCTLRFRTEITQNQPGNMKNLILTLSIIAVFIVSPTFGQESLQEKYDAILENNETYERYKVIPRTDLNAFWSEVSDTLNQKQQKIQQLQTETQDAISKAQQASAELSDVQAKLDESLELNDTIYFLGIPFSKVGYHIMVWIIIAALAVLGVMAYFMFMRSNSVTSKTKREFGALQAEFEAHKTKARETQVKLKRELQTAVNQLNERRS
ncbi:hypothetical protein SAMN05421640_2379 [Ekhidna lutea]|uniref:tRNA (Guanine-N1)-methyltransferase n=1 Tax=Ekhidna lutea TaxID=447679 RepID=A0A239K2K2_EKHLU|nr:hypothetical protein [Ekhidna lutea]SNT12305.1 hypothetical protein SAMN05421640_2379 [Ekhidna lutea]